jgi:hypothetical protein
MSVRVPSRKSTQSTGFQPAVVQKFVDPLKGLAQALVIDIADDGGQDQAQIGLRGKKIDRIHHGARL